VTEAELLGYKPILQSNAIETIKASQLGLSCFLFSYCQLCQILVNACEELAVPIEGPNAALAEKFENVSSVETSLTPDMAAELKKARKSVFVFFSKFFGGSFGTTRRFRRCFSGAASFSCPTRPST
jgi:hypothetical protein